MMIDRDLAPKLVRAAVLNGQMSLAAEQYEIQKKAWKPERHRWRWRRKIFPAELRCSSVEYVQ